MYTSMRLIVFPLHISPPLPPYAVDQVLRVVGAAMHSKLMDGGRKMSSRGEPPLQLKALPSLLETQRRQPSP
jgi:hypothetical protein